MTAKVTFDGAPEIVVQHLPKGEKRTGVIVSKTFHWLFVDVDGCEAPVAFDLRTGLRRGFTVNPMGWGVSEIELKRAVKWLQAQGRT